ncbi:hypothetical protein pb186bvf_010165 [Paramecium bursaria]
MGNMCKQQPITKFEINDEPYIQSVLKHQVTGSNLATEPNYRISLCCIENESSHYQETPKSDRRRIKKDKTPKNQHEINVTKTFLDPYDDDNLRSLDDNPENDSLKIKNFELYFKRETMVCAKAYSKKNI